MRKWIIIAVVVLILAGYAAYLQMQEKEETIKIGAVLPLTGDASFWGQSSKNGIALAVNDINDKGGINGKILEVIIEDGKCDSKTAVSAFSKLVDVDNVLAVIGDVCSSATLAMAPLAQEKKIILLSPCSESAKISEAGEYIFRTWTPNNAQATKMAEYLAVKNITKVSLMTINNDFGLSLSQKFKEVFSAKGGEIATEEIYSGDTRDFRTNLFKIKNSEPEALYMLSYIPDGIEIVKQSRELDLDVPIYATSAVESSEFVKGLGNLSEGIIFVTSQFDTDKGFIERWQKNYGEWSGSGSCGDVAYDDLMILVAAIKNAGENPTDIQKFMANLKDFDGVSGDITFDENGDLIKPQGVFIISNSTFVEVK